MPEIFTAALILPTIPQPTQTVPPSLSGSSVIAASFAKGKEMMKPPTTYECCILLPFATFSAPQWFAHRS